VILAASTQAKECWRLRQERDADVDSDDDAIDDDDDDDEDEDECQDLEDDQDADHSALVRNLQRLRDGEVDETDDDESDDDMAKSPLDDVDELQVLEEVLRSAPPQLQQQVAATLAGDMAELQKTFEEARAAQAQAK
jgi:hypothetical protein